MAGQNKDWNKKLILFGLETTEGTDMAPTPAANALKVLNYQPVFMDADQKVRNIEKAFFGADPVAMSNFKRGATFDMEMHGAGAPAGTGVPPWMIPLQVAGFGVPVPSASSVSISPITSGIKSATHWGYIDDLLLKTLGARASVGFKIEDDEYPIFSFNLLGIPPETLAVQAVPTIVPITGYIDPLISSTENTTFTLDGFALALRRWEMNSNSETAFRSLIGPKDKINISDRSWSGTIVGEIPDLTTKNYFEKVRPGTTMLAKAVQGIASGNIVETTAPALQITGNIEISEEGGKAMMSIPVTAIPVNGNDEIVFTSK